MNHIGQALFLVPEAGRSARSMSREIRRWLPRPKRTAASPWAEWARAYAERYAGIVQRGAPLGFVLLRRRGLSRILRERWVVRSERLLPTINLSVHAILRATGLTVFRQANVTADRNAQAVPPQMIVERRAVGEQTAMNRNPRTESYATSAFARASLSESPSSIERIFRRAKLSETPSEMNGMLGNALRPNQTVVHLAQRSERIESRFGDPVMAAARLFDSSLPAVRKKASQPAGTPDHGVEFIGGDSRSSLRSTDNELESTQWSDLARARESINIEQITDQVIRRLDQKVVAARERIGRTF